MLDQVRVNLAVNARGAMPHRGKIFRSTSTVEIGPEYEQTNSQARVGEFVCLSVRETGCDIAPEKLPRIFEPLFSTKDVGQGTGLGLATVFGIVMQLQGWIEVESLGGEGATFTVYLPSLARATVAAATRLF